MAEIFKGYSDKMEKLISQPGAINEAFTTLEKKTGIKRAYILYGILGIVGLWLAFGYGAQLLCNSIGFIYPAYCSIKALQTKVKEDDTQWLMYWVVFAYFSVLEFFSDILIGWVPFYWLSKCVFLTWCMSPLNGAGFIYEKIILPMFLKNEAALDKFVSQGKEKIGQLADNAVEKAKDYAAEQQLKKD